MNDSLRTDVFVRYRPEIIATACIYLSARKLKIPLPKNPSWFEVLGVEEDDIRDCCYRYGQEQIYLFLTFSLLNVSSDLTVIFPSSGKSMLNDNA